MTLRDDERVIIEGIVDRALKKGYLISVWDGEEFAVSFGYMKEQIMQDVGETDSTTLIVRQGDTRRRIGSIVLIHGNGEDVVHDYSANEQIEELVR